MADFFFFFSTTLHLFFLLLLFLFSIITSAITEPPPPPPPPPSSCQNKCGSLPIKYPFGTGFGCGSPRFYPSVSCSSTGDQLIFTTHAGSYPITSISYSTSILTITPTLMSTCSSMHSSPNFGLDWSSPFQLGPSLFILLACQPPTSSLTSKSGNPICDSSYSHLCTSLHTCPTLLSLGLPMFSPINTCCVYSPANLNAKGDLDLKALKCAGYSSVLSLGDIPTDPNRWEYGVALKYNEVGLDNYYNIAMMCEACEKSDGVCGYAPPRNNFVCVCKNGNSSSDCYNLVSNFWSSGSLGVGLGY
ncbi:Wall-associated receptor kinase galacturonan-binding domain [Macleaya cordata]|uniref:Wall-associated receptor kinase galacturonan-binding domain n=1 Tax=Macleaya cordata TaxID=56857 RepID=A0A200QUX3_MACCD|nr:Wall-associated receptor kinase galacturonan-binding domain [Macleaya cordata]